MIEKLFDIHLGEKARPETLYAYDRFVKIFKLQGVDVEGEALSDFSCAMERAGYLQGFADALALMQEAAAIRQQAG